VRQQGRRLRVLWGLGRRARGGPLAEGEDRFSVPFMDVFDWVLLALGSMVAVGALARLMLQRRDQLLTELDQQARQEQEQRRLAEVLRRKKQKEK
jgi:hypothetical protein